MKRSNRIRAKLIIGTALLLAAGWCYAQPDDGQSYVLLVQQSPADAGAVTPGTGVHSIAIGQTVALSAAPRPGYRFLYWLGDVSATTAPETTVALDSPKMIVAVFEREEFEEEMPVADLLAGQGRGGLIGSANPITAPPAISGTGRPLPTFPTGGGGGNGDTPPDDLPVPGDETDFWVPGEEVPEPATLVLLGLGSLLLRKRK